MMPLAGRAQSPAADDMECDRRVRDLLLSRCRELEPAGRWIARALAGQRRRRHRRRRTTPAASFLAWLLDTHGPDRVREIFAAPSDAIENRVMTVYGRSLDALEADWLRFCDTFTGGA